MKTVRNHITLIGNIGSATKITKFENGKSIARFNLATDNLYRNNAGKFTKSVEWHRVFAWGNMAEFIEKYGDKGKKVAIHGRLVNRSYLSEKGVKNYVTEVELKQIIGL
ncbi:MAG: single-stranded DNA-binding protein [Bacteroidota bacterium]